MTGMLIGDIDGIMTIYSEDLIHNMYDFTGCIAGNITNNKKDIMGHLVGGFNPQVIGRTEPTMGT